MKKIILGTRGSILALKQTEIVLNKLKKFFPELVFETKIIKTSGDINQNISLNEESVKNMFVKEIEEELLSSKIDLAVHSFKDMPNINPRGLKIGAIPDRADNRDVMITRNNEKLKELKNNAVIGTSSLRRSLQVLELRNDLEIRELRGNIHTRLKKLDDGLYDGIILAAAGLIRTGLGDRISEYFEVVDMMSSPCQGAICVQVRENDDFTGRIVVQINELDTEKIVMAEKEFSRIFDGGCKVPIGAFGKKIGTKLELSGVLFKDGKMFKDKITGDFEKYLECANNLAEKLRKKYE